MEWKNEKIKPKRVSYSKYLKLKKSELGTQYSIEKKIAFEQKYSPWGIVFFFRNLPRYFRQISDKRYSYKVRHLKLGRQKWEDDKLYIEKIPWHIASEPSNYLTAIIRDYLREYAKITWAVGNSMFEEDGEERNCYFVRAVGFPNAEDGEDGGLQEWRNAVNAVADKFDKAADKCAAAWAEASPDAGIALWKEYRACLCDAFDSLKVIFHDLDD